MKIAFDSSLKYQQEAIEAVTDLFQGQPVAYDEFSLSALNHCANVMGEIANQLFIAPEQILKNLQKVQKYNEVDVADALASLDFSIEMETGTGKTYVYLRTIYELNKLYGFKKFVIVVPSVAIREGVLKNLEITHEHFQNIYNNVPVHFQVYDRERISSLRSYASNNNIEILVINIDSFAKDENVINKPNDRLNGRKPIEFIQSTNPIVIVDEPQNMETEKRKQALQNLQAAFTLRYSATHKQMYHLIYSLDPVKAYDLGLVKQIEVDSVLEENNLNTAFVHIEKIVATKTKLSAKVKIHYNDKNGIKPKSVTVSDGDDLYLKSNRLEAYKDGFIVNGLDAEGQAISLSNGQIINQTDIVGTSKDEVMKYQIRRTIEEHLKKEKALAPQGIKVLSLFFIDKVANYRVYDMEGNAALGKIGQWFEEVYHDLTQNQNKESVRKLHNGYFSQDNKGRMKDTKGDSKSDDDTYNLIMRDKEKLLSLDNPLCFIFSHSALREGWDNPNVFQICTLNETASVMKKRQEIGRGLRLAVNQDGERIYDKNINRLTVVANESYDSFAKALQQEIEEDCGVDFSGRIKNKRQRQKIEYRKGFGCDPKFLAIWDKIKFKTTYRVNYDTDELIREVVKTFREMPAITAPLIRSTKANVNLTDTGVKTALTSTKKMEMQSEHWAIPDVLGYIQEKTELTRATIYEILKESGRLTEIAINPQLFLDYAVNAIRKVLKKLMIDGIYYQKIGEAEYEMRLLENHELEIYLDNAVAINHAEKTIYSNFTPIDSTEESQFAKYCERIEQL